MHDPMMPNSFPYLPTPSAADEGLVPPNFNGPPAYRYNGLLSSTVQPKWWGGRSYVLLSSYLPSMAAAKAVLSGGYCCTYAQYGCPCNCARRRDVADYLYQGMGSYNVGYAQPASDWPNVGTRMGFGPGPMVHYPEVFPLKGRVNLAPFMGY